MSEEQPGRGPLWEGLAHEEPMGPVAVPEGGAEGGGRGLARLLARRASTSRRGRGLQRAACSLTLHAVSAPGTPDTGPARAPPDSVPRPPARLALSPTTRVGQGQHRREVSCQEGPWCHAKAHLHGQGQGAGKARPVRSEPWAHVPLLGPGPFGLGVQPQWARAGGRCRMGLVLAGPGQGCAGCGIPLTAAGLVCGAASGTSHWAWAHIGRAAACGRVQSRSLRDSSVSRSDVHHTRDPAGCGLAGGVPRGQGWSALALLCPLPVPWASPVCSGGGAGGGGGLAGEGGPGVKLALAE